MVVGLALVGARALAAANVAGQIPPDQRGQIDLVYVEHVEGSFKPAGPAIMNQRNLAYVPHLLPVLRGTPVRFRSDDQVLHNVFARGPDQRVLFNLAVLPHMQLEKTLDALGATELTCSVHRAMLAFVFVLQNPYWAVPDEHGRWEIRGLPAGHYAVRVWGEALDDGARAKRYPIDVAAEGSQTLALPGR